jgi:hypothetical protein
MPHHVQVTVPPEHAPAVHEALLSVYGRVAAALSDAAATTDADGLRHAREELLDADAALCAYGWAPGARLDPAPLGGSGLLVHRVLGAALDDAAGTVALRLGEYEAGEVGLDDVARALSALTGLFDLFARVERREEV